MFKDQLGKTMEVYIDDMLVKSTKKEDHIGHLKEAFEILKQYGMKLNPEKCTFGVTSRKFLDFLMSKRGIKVNPDQIKAIDAIPEGRLAKWAIELSEHDITYQPRTAIKSQVLADFVADFSTEILPKVEQEALCASTHTDLWVLYTDGASNSSGSGLGLVLEVPMEFDECRFNQVPRVQNIEADGLAKLVAATSNINKENMVALLHSAIDHAEDGMLPQDKKEAKKLRVQAARYNLVNGDLYKRTFGGPQAKCLGPHQTRRVLEEVHEGHCGAHTVNRALIRCHIRASYYRPTMKKEAADYVRRCEQCRKYAPMIHQAEELLHSVHTLRYAIRRSSPSYGKTLYFILASPKKSAATTDLSSSEKERLSFSKSGASSEYSPRHTTLPPMVKPNPPIREPSLKGTCNDKSRLQDLDEVEERRDMAHIRMVAQKQQVERYYNKRAK
uniref:Reverse transcriptase domain-containing protein n=1 Tax=Nicotiana tabacum TaxID=4097 RepID=A0A1S4AII4_TOBAC